MLSSQIALSVYAAFLLLILVINLLYFFQIFRFRLPGDASVPLLVVHLGLVMTILIISGIYLTSL